MSIPINTKELKIFLEENVLFLSKRSGQNFLVDKDVLEKIVTVGCLTKKDSVIEVGAGIGTLTLALSLRAKRVIAIEKDKKLIPFLKEFIKKEKNIKIVNKDVLNFQNPFLDYKVIANIPYYITSPIIRKFLEDKVPPKLLVLTVQKEVAQRIIAKPPKMNLLAVSVQFFAKPEIISNISPFSFYPQPKVTSSILRIIPYNKNCEDLKKDFFSLLRVGFSHPRKQLGTNFANFYKQKSRLILENMKEIGIDKKRRAETISVEEWIRLAKITNEARR